MSASALRHVEGVTYEVLKPLGHFRQPLLRRPYQLLPLVDLGEESTASEASEGLRQSLAAIPGIAGWQVNRLRVCKGVLYRTPLVWRHYPESATALKAGNINIALLPTHLPASSERLRQSVAAIPSIGLPRRLALLKFV